MKRVHSLVLIVAVVFVAAVAMRVRSHLDRERVTLEQGHAGSLEGAAPERPRDYVMHPDVWPGEAGRGPGRIISLAPSVTETLCALGLKDRLVGRTQFCDHPPDVVDSVEAVGAIMDLNYDRVKTLEPDLILAPSNIGDVVGELGQLGLHVETIPHDTYEELLQAIERVGRICGREKTARLLIGQIWADVARLRQAVEASDVPARDVLLVTGPVPVPPGDVWVAGPGSFLDTLLGFGGHRNAVHGQVDRSFTQLALPRLIEIDPEVMLQFTDDAGPDHLRDIYESWDKLGHLQAIEHQQVRTLPADWLSAGPRVAIALYEMIEALSPAE